jgi:hypothetical protein
MSSDDPAVGGPHFGYPRHVYARRVSGQMVLLNLENEEYFGLDEVGSNFIEKLTVSPPDVVLQQLEQEYTVDSKTLRSDLDSLLETLLDAGLLERLPTAQGRLGDDAAG